MATKVPIPKLGQSEETVSIEKWRVKEGDKIKKGDVLFEVETDKAVLEVESQFEGTLLKIVIPEGKEVPVMSIAAVIGEPGEEIPEIELPQATKTKKEEPKKIIAPDFGGGRKTETDSSATQNAEKKAETRANEQNLSVDIIDDAFIPRPTPRARKFAENYLIDIGKVPATGGKGKRITERDVKKYLRESGYFDKKITPAAFNLAKKEGLCLLDIEGSSETGRITLTDVRNAVSEKPQPLSSMRKIIAQRLTSSKQNVPHFYVTQSIDMTPLTDKRADWKEEGISISVNTFIIKAVSLALREFPKMNSCFDERSFSVIRKAKVNIGVAVSLPDGLVVPVVKNADKKMLDEIQDEVSELAEKARNNRLSPDEMQGGTFTISNMGMLNVENFAAIINPGEAGILAVSSVISTPVVKEKEIVVRKIMKITLSADHRIIDGADGAKFVNIVKNMLECSSCWDDWI